MSEVCGAESMRPLGGGVAFFRGSGDVLGGKEPLSVSGPRGHFCQLPKGHDGPHQCQYLERVGPNLGSGMRYVWDDEHQLVGQPFFCCLAPDPMQIVPWPKPLTPEERAAKEAALVADGFTKWEGGKDFPLPADTMVTAVFDAGGRDFIFREIPIGTFWYPSSWRHEKGCDPIIAYRVRETEAHQ